jgi:hypothetical protein
MAAKQEPWPGFQYQVPATLDEAKIRLAAIEGDIGSLKVQLELPTRFHGDGTLMTPGELASWKKRATGALGWMFRERSLLTSFIRDYRRQEQTAHERAMRDQRKPKAETPVDAVASLKLERQRLHNEQMEVARERKILEHERKQRHRERIILLATDEDVKLDDPDSLLRAAYRVLYRLFLEKQVHFADGEIALIDAIREIELNRKT